MMMRSLGIAALICPALAAAAQEQPDVDRADPTAVAEAYLSACRQGDVDAALGLVALSEAALSDLRLVLEAQTPGDPGHEPSAVEQLLAEVAVLPLGLSDARRTAEPSVVGQQASVTVRLSYTFEQSLLLTQADDGTWWIDLLASLRAASRDSPSSLVAMIESADARREQEQEMAVGERLYELWEAAMLYAKEHDGVLPRADEWVTALAIHVDDPSKFRNPRDPDRPYGFAMNSELSEHNLRDGQDVGEEEREVPLLFEWPQAERNATASPDQLGAVRGPGQSGSLVYVTLSGQRSVLPAGVEWAEHDLDEGRQPAWRAVVTRRTGYRACSDYVEKLAQAALRYAGEHGGRLPSADSWQDDIAASIAQALAEEEQPLVEGDTPYGVCDAAPDLEFPYAINAEVAGKSLEALDEHETTVLFFESDINRRNAAGDPEADAPAEGRHTAPWGGDERVNVIAYLDGHSAVSVIDEDEE